MEESEDSDWSCETLNDSGFAFTNFPLCHSIFSSFVFLSHQLALALHTWQCMLIKWVFLSGRSLMPWQTFQATNLPMALVSSWAPDTGLQLHPITLSRRWCNSNSCTFSWFVGCLYDMNTAKEKDNRQSTLNCFTSFVWVWSQKVCRMLKMGSRAKFGAVDNFFDPPTFQVLAYNLTPWTDKWQQIANLWVWLSLELALIE